MSDPFQAFSIAILFTVFLCLYRALRGPGIINRIIAVNVIATKTIALILLIGTVFERVDFFVDIALLYALINFISTLAFSKYLDLKGIS